ncbi:DivIVA domain-containing protein [Kribbella monticola]|uniref:DivIVA domain-containing protein n=1 Tax=Kribbella monticola TaxID=2185285 RepID=UPI000DD45062|nr:DivIVA domain-containing protein [Kribbella monticola]
MTPEDPFARRPAQSPYAIRHQTFPTRRKGLDPAEVLGYLSDLAEQIEYADADRAELRAELERLRASTPDADQRAHITAHAVGLLSQAQQIADNLVAEAEQYAKDLVESARHQQRDVLQQAHDSVESAVKHLPRSDAQAAELEYVRTFTQVAHVQLRSVLDALAEQVERLGHFPQDKAGDTPPADTGEVEWWTDLSAGPVDQPHPAPARHGGP